MRAGKMKGYNGEIKSTFLSCEKDTEAILKKLFVDSKPYSDMLKRLLIINTKDCLFDMTNPEYNKRIKEKSVAKMYDEGYIRLNPNLEMGENEQVKSYILITFDNFAPCEKNPHFRDCTVMIDIICHTQYWDVGNYRQRPLKIAGYIDGILNECKLSGLGTLNFMGCNEIVISEELSGYCLTYAAVHGSDDFIPEAGDPDNGK